MQTDKYHIDMCRGPLFSKIVLFSVPLILSGILQLLFNAADLIVIGHFAPHEAMAAVGATTFITALIVNVFIGLSVGTNVLVANYLGAKDRKNVSSTYGNHGLSGGRRSTDHRGAFRFQAAARSHCDTR